MPSSSHQAKRPYGGTHSHQSTITSYFTSPNPSSTSSTSASSLPLLRTSVPALPTSIQSSLLNVGMRVRKSVPEGYKTGSAYSSFALFSDQASAPPMVQLQQQQQQRQRRAKQTRSHAAARELAPFCGIMKVGGLAQQVSHPDEFDDDEDVCLDDEVPDESDFPILSSQGSTLSTFSTSTTHKRRLSTTSEDGEDQRDDWADVELSPKSRFPHAGQQWGGVVNRTLAVPRRRVKAVGMGMAGQENAVGVVGVAGDFEDAGFLDYEVLGEVDMGGL